MNNESFKKIISGDFHDRLFAFMNELGIDKIILSYSGGGDSGSVDNLDLKFSKKNTMSLGDRNNLVKNISEVFEEELAQPIWDKHGSFADGGGYSVDGYVTYSVKDKSVVLSGTDHYWGQEYDDSEDEDAADIEEQSRDEDWEDVILLKENIDNTEEEYDFAYFYAKHIIKGKLPEELHNRVLIAATDGDIEAKKYIQGLKK